ncbi:MAG: 4a-hydroxytetrahydrobiopterin dehydratase [Thermoanaerobaculia bacterium]
MSSTQQRWKEETVLLGFAPERMHLKPETVRQLLGRLPGWSLAADGHAIERRWLFKSVDEAAAFVGTAGKLGMSQRQPIAIALAGRHVGITFAGHPIKGCTGGLTNPVFRLAGILG